MGSAKLKQETHQLVDGLPDDSTWHDLMHEIYVRQAIEAGLKDSEAEHTIDVRDVRTRFGLPE